jgi:hypothetical protein
VTKSGIKVDVYEWLGPVPSKMTILTEWVGHEQSATQSSQPAKG